jgi:hypothetical protein
MENNKMATSLWQRGTRALLTLTLLLGLTGCGMNTIPTLDEQVKASWGQVENQYQRRADLIPQPGGHRQGVPATSRRPQGCHRCPCPSRQRAGE